ncbi:MAG: ABC transporter permease subunit [Clostridiales bacterium]|jgi:ABC-type Na+ efflux pump permease subunit|nr:ABC transporter permease subunit [Clostridiales bacterium]
MSKSNLVFRIQFAGFMREKGMIVFYCLSIAIIGVVAPLFLRGATSSLTMTAVFAVLFLKPILADSLAGARERRTLEPLLSSPISGKSIVWGKFKFCLWFAVCFFALAVLCAALTARLVGSPIALTAVQWVSIALLAVLNFSAISISGVHASATSGDTRSANRRISRISYPLGLSFAVYPAVIVSADIVPALIVGGALMLIYLCVLLTFVVKTSKMKPSDFFENMQTKNTVNPHEQSTSFTPKSQFAIVLGFELKYLRSLKTLLVNFGILCLAPALFAWIFAYYSGGRIDLNYAVFVTVFMIPRAPTNLIAYSIGGEKAYKTGESLLSAPLHISPIFLAKCMVPILVSAVMLIVSALVTLMGASILGWTSPDIAPLVGYTAAQLVLLFPVSIMASGMMTFISAILSVILKTPRHGLYATSIISIVFLFPALAIVYLAQNILLWSVIYFAVLLIGNAICIKRISDKITRPQIMRLL